MQIKQLATQKQEIHNHTFSSFYKNVTDAIIPITPVANVFMFIMTFSLIVLKI